MLGVFQIFSYIMVLGIAAAVPGPGMTNIVARSVSNGFLFGFYALFGLIIGDLIYLSIAVFGYSIIVSHFSYLFKFIVWGASFYLIYLAWQFWFNPYKILGLTYNNKKSKFWLLFVLV